MNKSLSLSLELHVVSTFWLGSDTSGTFSLHFAQPSYELERPAFNTGRCSYYTLCRTDICSCKLSEKVSLILGNPFLVPSLCKLNHMYQRLFHPDQHEIIWHIEYFFFTFCPAIIWTWETSLGRCSYFGAELTFVAANFLQKSPWC